MSRVHNQSSRSERSSFEFRVRDVSLKPEHTKGTKVLGGKRTSTPIVVGDERTSGAKALLIDARNAELKLRSLVVVANAFLSGVSISPRHPVCCAGGSAFAT